MLDHDTRIFSDNFESGGLSTSNWSFRDASVVRERSDSAGFQYGPKNPRGTYAVQLNGFDEELRSRSFNLAGANNVVLRYRVQAEGHQDEPETHDDLLVQYRRSNGSWATLRSEDVNSVNHASFTSRSVTLPSAALHSNAAFRFNAYASDTVRSGFLGRLRAADYWFIDDVWLNANRPPSVSFSGRSGTLTDAQAAAGQAYIEYRVNDADGNVRSVSARLYKNGVAVGSARTGTSGRFTISAAESSTGGLGSYYVRVSASDAGGLSTGTRTSGTLRITDDDTSAPSLSLTDISSPTAAAFRVSGGDSSGVAAVTYQVYRNGAAVTSGSLGSFGSSFSRDVSLAAYGTGEFRVDVTATDNDRDRGAADQRSRATSLTFTVDDDTTPPEVVLTGDSGNDGQDNRFTWAATDASGIAAVAVSVVRNGVTIFNPANPGPSGSFDLNPYGTGTYTLRVAATDADNDHPGDQLTRTVERTIVITDDDTAPPTIQITSGPTVDGLANAFEWVISDPSGVSAGDVTILQDGNVIAGNIGSPSGSFPLDSYGLGTFSIAVTATDADNDSPGDQSTGTAGTSFVLTDDDVDGPTVLLGGSSGVEYVSDPQSFMWDASDPSGLASVAVTVTQDGVPVYTSTDESGQFDFDSLLKGDFEVTVVAADADDDWAGDASTTTVTRSVTVANTAPQAIVAAVPDIIEGGGLSLDASGSSDIDQDALTFAWDIDNDGQFDDAFGSMPSLNGAEVIALGLNDDGPYTVRVFVSDGLEGTIAEQTFAVTNAGPVVVSFEDVTIDESGIAVVSGSFTDAGPADTHAVLIN